MAVNGYAAAQDVADLKASTAALAVAMGSRVNLNEEHITAAQAAVAAIPGQLEELANSIPPIAIAQATETANAIVDDRALKSANAGDFADAAEVRANIGILPTISAVLASTASLGAVGDIIQAGGHRYEIVASDEHITTAGGIKLKALKSAGRYFTSAFGMVPDMPLSDANAALQAAFDALAAGDTLELDFEGTIDISDATLSTAGAAVVHPKSAHLRQSNSALNAHAIKITGSKVSWTGEGAISSHITDLSDYFTTGSGIARSILHVTGNRPYIEGIEINTPARCGIFLDGCESPTTLNLRGDGGYALADYNPAGTLNLYAVYYSPSGQSALAKNVWKNAGNIFTHYITPEASGPLSGAGSYIPEIYGSFHEECWDHGYYLLGMKDGVVLQRALNTRLPFAGALDGTVYEGHLVWTVTSGLNAEAGISIRDTLNGGKLRNIVMEGGLGGYIDFRPPSAVGDIEIKIEGLRTRPSGPSTALLETIRADNFVGGVAPTADILSVNITGLDIVNKSTGATPVVRVRGASGHVIPDVVVSGKVQHTGSTFAYDFDYCDDADFTGLVFDRSGYSAGAPVTLDSVLLKNCNRARVVDPLAVYRVGGTNVTARGINVAASCTDTAIIGGKNLMTSGDLAAKSLIVDSGVRTFRSRNQYSTDPTLEGTATLPSGTGSAIVSNPNVRVGSRIWISPMDAGAAEQYSTATHDGVFGKEEAASGRLLIRTGTAASTAVAGLWAWRVDG